MSEEEIVEKLEQGIVVGAVTILAAMVAGYLFGLRPGFNEVFAVNFVLGMGFTALLVGISARRARKNREEK